jgi:hypothetical protein
MNMNMQMESRVELMRSGLFLINYPQLYEFRKQIGLPNLKQRLHASEQARAQILRLMAAAAHAALFRQVPPVLPSDGNLPIVRVVLVGEFTLPDIWIDRIEPHQQIDLHAGAALIRDAALELEQRLHIEEDSKAQTATTRTVTGQRVSTRLPSEKGNPLVCNKEQIELNRKLLKDGELSGLATFTNFAQPKRDELDAAFIMIKRLIQTDRRETFWNEVSQCGTQSVEIATTAHGIMD